MSVILLVLGLVVAAVGIATIGFGIPINEFTLGTTLIIAGSTALILAMIAWRRPVIRSVTTLPTLKAEAITPFSSE